MRESGKARVKWLAGFVQDERLFPVPRVRLGLGLFFTHKDRRGEGSLKVPPCSTATLGVKF